MQVIELALSTVTATDIIKHHRRRLGADDGRVEVAGWLAALATAAAGTPTGGEAEAEAFRHREAESGLTGTLNPTTVA